ncbi:MAG: tripartite tricarboxylate transporter TctB family protein [Gammaproteobacteria bacterium]
MHIRNSRDFWGGVMFAVFGALFAYFATSYDVGTGARMGPGYFPLILGILLALLGVIVAWSSTSVTNPVARLEPVGWRELFMVLGAVAVFAVLLPWLGMVVSVSLLILISAMADYQFSWKETILSIIVLVIMSYFVFVKGLELQFPVWPRFLLPA